MGSPLPPDPYLALGVPKDATTANIKTAHRKLVLKCHPDKVTDPAAKEEASDKFHKIQTAYELLVDEDRRARYDAQLRLAELRKEAMERQGGSGSRATESRSAPSPYKTSHEPMPRSGHGTRSSERVAPQYEERKPSYAAAESYFDPPPRPTARKESEYERSSRRSGHDVKEKEKPRGFFSRSTKENERDRRKEKARKAEKDTRKDRDRKHTPYAEDDSESGESEYARWAKEVRDHDEERKAKEEYYNKARQQQQAADDYHDDRTRKMFSASNDARDYIQQSMRSRQRPDSERRPSPVRMSSSRDNTDYLKGRDGRPAAVRKVSERPKLATRDSERKTSSRRAERRTSADGIAEEREERKAAPALNHAKSSPADIRLPTEKTRSYSLQPDADVAQEISQLRRAETMPYGKASRTEQSAPYKRPDARQTEMSEGLPTPAATPGATPDHSGAAAAAKSSKYRYGRQYADDEEYPTPDGYRTELRSPETRQPSGSTRPAYTRKVTRSPSPVKDVRDRETRHPREDRERPRTTSARYPDTTRPPLQPSRTTSYVYTPGQGVEPTAYGRQRPGDERDRSPRETVMPPLHTDIRNESRPTSGSPRQKYGAYAPPEDNPRESVRYAPRMRPEDLKVRSGQGYSRQHSSDRPPLSRNGSGNTIHTGVRA
ncbi:uncharacterized protein CLAFUR5_00570 [Fulvia fulva]|uniref:J domain-containing protein n=1 Tax=Passalora fulva TaxID=5499 RepID=A0A9Q8P2T0_PASFU|nr:uncharacterized protein CLAFUR5_00570 [Fulvia fulva]KAK4636354.1 hypothetical protein CLAFUR0_00573 [Fulvia fulva]UJO11265.1 hypothetical protein CLAFUR5_00570 [Fulvia fulva]